MDEPLRPPPEALQLGDEQLARLVTSGSTQAFSTLYERYRELLYRYCRSILLDEADAHDAAQSTFTRVLDALQRGQRDAPLRPWLFRIAHNESISMLRRRKAAHALHFDLGPLAVAVEDRLGHREQVGLLLDDLQELPPRQRGAIVMRELGGLSHEEIGAALRLSVSSARQAIFEARAALNEFAQGREMACEDVRRELSEGHRRVMRRRPIRAHLRDCAACAAFAEGLRGPRAGLHVLGAPIAVAYTRLLVRLLGSRSGSVVGASSGGGGFMTEAFNNLGALAAKPIAALAVGLTAAASTGTVIYGLSQRSANRAGAIEHVTQAVPETAEASVAPVPPRAGRARSPFDVHARLSSENGVGVRFVIAAAAPASERAGAFGALAPSSLSATSTPRVGARSAAPPRSGVQQPAAGRGNGGASQSAGQTGGSGGGSSGSTAPSVTTGATGGGSGASSQPAGQAAPSGGGSGTAVPPPAASGNGNAQGGSGNAQGGSGNAQGGSGSTQGGNGNAQGGNGSGQGGNGNAQGGNGNAQGENGNGGQRPVDAALNGGKGNGGQPPGLSGSHGGNGNGAGGGRGR